MTTKFTRDITQGRQSQGADEEIVYTLTTTNWGTSPSSVTVKAYDLSNASADVSTTVLSGSASVSGDVITLPTVKSLTAGRIYQIEVKFTAGGSVFETPFIVLCAGFTYIGDLSTDRDKVRFNLGDTDPGGGPLPNDENFTDGELDGLITAEGSWGRAVAAGFENLAAKWRRYPTFRADGLSLNRSDIANGYAKDAAKWRRQYGGGAGAGYRAMTRVDGYSDDIDSHET